jgi:hypothetical protein
MRAKSVGNGATRRRRAMSPLRLLAGVVVATGAALSSASLRAAGAPDGGVRALHTAFIFWTHPLTTAGSGGDVYYTENLKHSMVVTTPFSRWTCVRGEVVTNKRGNWYGGFTCVDNNDPDLAVSLDVECSPSSPTPVTVEAMSVHEKGRDRQDVGVQFLAGCSTTTDVPLRGEVGR